MNQNTQFDGYVSDLTYTNGYYRTQSPAILAFAMLARGFLPPDLSSFRYLELGYGQGQGINIHGAASSCEFWGTDFLPQHASNARTLASTSGANVTALDNSFQELLERKDLPNFDFITLHGVWTWIADKNREEIVNILRQKLNPGGVVQISYNCQPGWTAMVPIQHLLKLHKEFIASNTADSRENLKAAIHFVDALSKTNASFLKAYPDAVDKIEWLKSTDLTYLVHELYNDNWPVMPFSEVADDLGRAKLNYICPSGLLDHLEVFSLTPDQRTFVNSIGNIILRETVRDYCMNRRFRSDVFAKGARAVPKQERNDHLRKLQFVLLRDPTGLDYEKIPTGPAGSISLKKNMAEPIVNSLASENYSAMSIAELETSLESKNIALEQIAEVLVALTGVEFVTPILPDKNPSVTLVQCQNLNTELLRRAEFEVSTNTLASPIAGAGIVCSRIHQLFLGAIREGKKTQQEWMDHAWKKLNAQGHSFLKNGEPIKDEKENLKILAKEAKEFNDKHLHMLKAHQIL